MIALSALIAASLTEDPYGQVQRDIPRTLEAFTNYLSALERFTEQLQMGSQVPGKWAEEADETMKVIQLEVEPLVDGQFSFPLFCFCFEGVHPVCRIKN